MRKYKYVLFFLVAALTSLQSIAQSGISMQSTYSSAAIEDPTDLAKCSNGDVVVTGNLLDTPSSSGIAFRTDSLGIPIWSFTYSASVNITIDRATETLDGGLCFMGSMGDAAAHETNNILLIKTNSTGQIQWTKKLSGTFGAFATATDFYQGTDSCYYVCGYLTNASINTPVALKTNPSGQLLWLKSFSTGNAKATTLISNDVDRMAIGVLDSLNGDLIVVEIDTAGTLTNSVHITHSAGSPIISAPSCTFNIAATYYQFCVNSDIPYMNMTNWTLDITSSLQLVDANPFYRSDGALQLVEIMPSSTYDNVFLLSSSAGFSHTLTQDPNASTFSIGCFIDTFSMTYPVSFKYLNNHVMMILTEDTNASGDPDGFMLTRTLNPIPLYSHIPIDGCHMRGSGALTGQEGFSWSPGGIVATNLSPQAALSPIAVSSGTYSMTFVTNCTLVDVPETRISTITVNTLLSPDDNLVASNLPGGSKINIYDIRGALIYTCENYSNDLQASALISGLYVYEFITPDGNIFRGKFVVQ